MTGIARAPLGLMHRSPRLFLAAPVIVLPIGRLARSHWGRMFAVISVMVILP